MGLTPNATVQLSLFTTANPKHQPLMRVVDRLNHSIGKTVVRFATQSIGRQWKMKQEKLSQRYTTNIKEVVEIEL
jgi:DNA polymerase V